MSPRAEPHFFGPEARRLFGFYHPSETPASVGLVIANAFGDEAIRTHRLVRHVANEASRRGVPALRFDYDGTGDSAGDDRDPGRIQAFIASIRLAIAELEALAGVTRVALFGVRLGALLASEAAIGRDDVCALVAFAPVVSGRLHARELKALHRAIGLRESPTGARLEAGSEEAAGFVLTEETRASLAGLDLSRANAKPAPRVVVLERDDLPSSDAWPKKLRELGARVEVLRPAGYVEMMLDPHESIVPEAAVRAAIDFVAEDNAPSGAAASSTTRTTTRMTAPNGDGVRESAVWIEGGVFGVLTSPDEDAPAKKRSGVVLLNAGAIHHVGPNRLHVTFARRLAAAGHRVLRLDLRGLGDSPPRGGERDNVTYPRSAHGDIARAIQFLANEPNVAEVHAAGICSGAYHAFSAAVRGAPIASAVAINPLTFFWHEGSSVVLPAHKIAGEAQRYSRAALDPQKWKKLFRGEVDVRAFAQVARGRALEVALRRVRDAARALGRPFPDDLGAALERAAKNGVTLRFIVASDDPGLEVLRGGGSASFEKLVRRGAITVEVIEGPNHTFTQVWSQDSLLAKLTSIFER